MNKQLLDTLDTDQQRALQNVRAAVDRIWSRPLHRYYTDHTTAHSQRVIVLLDGLIISFINRLVLMSLSFEYSIISATSSL